MFVIGNQSEKQRYTLASQEEKHGFCLVKKNKWLNERRVVMGEYFMASLVLQFPCQRQEILPRWRLFGAQIAPLQEDNARFLEEKWWTSDKKKLVFSLLSYNLTSL